MAVNVNKLRSSVRSLLAELGAGQLLNAEIKTLQKFLSLKNFTSENVEKVLDCLGNVLLKEDCTIIVGMLFDHCLLAILARKMPADVNNPTDFLLKCFALSKLMPISVDADRHARKFFRSDLHPFQYAGTGANKRPREVFNEYRSPIIVMCYRFLSWDPSYFKSLWHWTEFMGLYNGSDSLTELDRVYMNRICAILFNMSSAQLEELNAKIKPDDILAFHRQEERTFCRSPAVAEEEEQSEKDTIIEVNSLSDAIAYIEGVYLHTYSKENVQLLRDPSAVPDKLVKVDSTKANLRSIAMGVASGKAICLSGPVGCGKTSLVEYLARLTGRICDAKELHSKSLTAKENLSAPRNGKEKKLPIGEKRSSESLENGDRKQSPSENLMDSSNGYFRIQLGDQTDSKMLLGQYRCTDVPGEFIWLPGVLTKAVMNGSWLLLEDLDSATQDTYTILSSLMENKYLSVPGYRDYIEIKPGFQLFMTVRSMKSAGTSAKKSLYSLLEKYLYTINILPLSRNELCKVVSTNYPKLATVANRIVDVFLTFSSGDHSMADNLREQEVGDKADTTDKFVALPFEAVAMMPNAGRLVSTRDLIKLCERSDPVFSVTSTECAYFVFQNAVDLFCSHLPQGTDKTKFIVSIGAKLGIIQSRCEFFANEYKPEVSGDSGRIKVGRAELFTKPSPQTQDENSENVVPLKRAKISAAPTRSTFSFTRMATCVLERIAVCVAQAEPVLLVGETGVGKTSSVQYLAERTEHKLVVVNMNNQSDVSDLVGGYKPVSIGFVVGSLRSQFEGIFGRTFNIAKNEAFLRKIAVSFNEEKYGVAIRSMLTVANSALKRQDDMNASVSSLLPEWRDIRDKLVKMKNQLAKSMNISFAFIAGSLVNCITNGDWVLLDEINLASAETLECLSTILEPDGSIVLLEKGDYLPVTRHPEFRIFACMNPNTDIGKKDLPVGIRNRFTEFFVDELTTDADLSLLVSDYLASTGIQKKSVSSIVKLFKRLKQLSKLELNDGLGNRPVFSLRTLCRSLRVCAKNLCGSIERNLYESMCMSFLTQLDPTSHQVVLYLIKEALLSNEKAVLKQAIPKPGDNYLNFEGYWIQQGPQPIQECSDYILTESIKENLRDLARIISIGKLPVLLQGPTSAGKTSLIGYVAKRSGNHCLRINNHEHTDLQEYIGTYAADETGKLSFKEGVLVQAMRNGYWIILDELNLASTDILEALNRVLDDNRELFIPETQTLVKAHPNFMLFATQNPPGLYGGRKTLSRAFKNRFIELHFSDIPRKELEVILEKRCLIPASYAKRMVACMAELQKNRKTTTKNIFTLRDLFRWGNRYTFADKKLLEDNLYDWNQHLIEEGYLVLSAKVRTAIEIEIIEETLYKTFKKRIDLKRLFDVTNVATSSPVTRDILTSIKDYTQRADIVWTLNMTRMAVLAAKALQFNEPVLLVGPTGCGKTTVCQILASIRGVELRILNCHMHTEGADFLGGLRPCRDQSNNEGKGQKLFEWSDGPLIHSMVEGSYFMADEISLAEDSVLERLNCILEPERTVLLAEKGGVADEGGEEDISKNFVVEAKEGFQFLATMNPGGDFGKKELSPALRNRFTEIWCLPSDSRDDLIRIASNCMLEKEKSTNPNRQEIIKIATYLVEIVLHIRDVMDKFKFSIRDILAWANYLSTNKELSFSAKVVFGLETVFLDALEMLPHESFDKLEATKTNIIDFAIRKAAEILGERFSLEDVDRQRGDRVQTEGASFGIEPFYLPKNPQLSAEKSNDSFQFMVPTTKKNLFRLLSALTLNKPILLEGPPGVGKTSIVESICKAIGYRIVRINLCEHTDLADLFGTDLPADEDETKVLEDSGSKAGSAVGQFVWRDGPLLAALKSECTWILLDELNLAPQSVLEGLNAILDHRGEVYIPELNKTFELSRETRIFACQNPLKQGGGRKGLPQSFLNRFNKVYLRKLNTQDLEHVVRGRYSAYLQSLRNGFLWMTNGSYDQEDVDFFDLYNVCRKGETRAARSTDFVATMVKRFVRFSEILDEGVASMEFGYKGGPFEFNLRDLMRWADSLENENTGFKATPLPETLPLQVFAYNFEKFLLTLYERMKLVYYQRMRSDADKAFIRKAFGEVFECDAEHLQRLSEDVCLYWTDDKIYLNDIVLPRQPSKPYTHRPWQGASGSPMLLGSQREMLKSIVECVHLSMPVLICGGTDSGKTKLIEAMCSLAGQTCNTDTIDDSVTGSFQQVDLNRHLEAISERLQFAYESLMQDFLLHESIEREEANQLMGDLETVDRERSTPSANFGNIYISYLEHLLQQCGHDKKLQKLIRQLIAQIKLMHARFERMQSFNGGGSFEWVDSKIVKSLKCGQYISLEHVNLCSSAVLDRLNPIFEPNGSLLISEKGVTAEESAEVVHKSPNFRAFLTVDPRNGDLSRAMRNRCVELSLNKSAYERDDLRSIIHSHGIRDVRVINALLRIHDQIENLTEISVYSMSNLSQAALLVASYKRIGYPMWQAIYVSVMEVYVYSATTDLLGYGLAYYQNKLRLIVLDEIEVFKREMKSQPSKIVDPMRDFSLNCGNLGAMTMIQLQATPLMLLLSGPEWNSKAITSIWNAFDAVDFEHFERNTLTNFYLYMLYEASSLGDVEQRHRYINELIEGSDELKVLSQRLYNCIQRFPTEDINAAMKKLPWNRKLMPRLRDYEPQPWAHVLSLRWSAQLLMKFLLREIPDESVKTLEHISALAYSRGVASRLISDKHKNNCINHLFTFIDAFARVIDEILLSAVINVDGYVELIPACLWFNRLLKVSERSLFNGNQIDGNLIDQILVHIKWLQKHLWQCLAALDKESNHLESNKELNASLAGIKKSMQKVQEASTVWSKKYAKHFVQYPPFYERQQVVAEWQMRKVDRLLGHPCRQTEFEANLRQILAAKLHIKSKLAAALGPTGLHLSFDYKFSQGAVTEATDSPQIPSELLALLKEFFVDGQESEMLSTEQHFDSEQFRDSLVELERLVNNDEYQSLDLLESAKEQALEWFPLREYFLTKALAHSLVYGDQAPSRDFGEDIPWMSIQSFHLLKYMESPQYQKFQAMWKAMMAYSSGLSEADFARFIDYASEMYRQVVSFERVLTNAMFMQQTRNLESHRAFRTLCNSSSNEAGDYEGPLLLSSMVGWLFKGDGGLRLVPLKQLASWQSSLKQTQELIWLNSKLMTPGYNQASVQLELASATAQRLLKEYAYAAGSIDDGPNQQDTYLQGLRDLHDLLEDSQRRSCLLLRSREAYTSSDLQHMQFESCYMNTLIGFIELSLSSFLPQIDPVVKNRLKREYTEEDKEYLGNLLQAYKLLQISMRYHNLGGEITHPMQEKLRQVEEKLQQFSKKIAERPDTCVYRDMAEHVRHFLRSHWDPKKLSETMKKILEEWHRLTGQHVLQAEDQQRCKLLLQNQWNWSENARSFMRSMLEKYDYYMDILQPVEYGLNRSCCGLDGLRAVIASRLAAISWNTPVIRHLNAHGKVDRFVANLMKFPSACRLRIFDVNTDAEVLRNQCDIYGLVSELSHGEQVYFKLLKSKLLEVSNVMKIRGDIPSDVFCELDFTLNVCNQIWQTEEERRRSKQAEEESLYVSKTKCENEDEELQELQEIAEYFPTNVEEDFGEFLEENTLEKVMRLDKKKDLKAKTPQLLNAEDYAFWAKTFIALMEDYTSVYYYNNREKQSMNLHMLESFQERLQAAVNVFSHYRQMLHDQVDSECYNTFASAVGLQRHLLNASVDKNVYNFYKDPNVNEITSCMDVLERIDGRVTEELKLYPEHASLLDIKKVIKRIYDLPATAPVVRFNTGFQILRQKITQWNEVAHRLNNLQTEEFEVAEYVQKWTKLELQFWRNCLNQTHARIEGNGYKYWFFIYNLVSEYIQDHEVDSTLTDIKYTEKRFADEEVLDAKDIEQKAKVSAQEIGRILRQFVEAANYGDFHIRQQLLHGFELYLHHKKEAMAQAPTAKFDELIAILRNMQIYYAQFAEEIQETQRSMRGPIEKKLREFVKIESYSKDLSYFSMRNNVARVHRNLNKFLKEYSTQLQQKITPVFQPTDATVKDYNVTNGKGKDMRYDSKVKYNMVDVKNFVALEKLNTLYPLDVTLEAANEKLLLPSVAKLFATSRNIVKDTLNHTPYPKLIIALDILFSEQLERCEHLRSLQVDRSKERPHQVTEAKQILQQKRKGLTDLFKILAQLGLNYRKGLMELSLGTEFDDSNLPPFCLKTMMAPLKPNKHIHGNILQLNDNLDKYYSKCVFKLKLLHNIMLAPLSELGPPIIDRIKGFATDFFDLVQSQRRHLSHSVKGVHQLLGLVENVREMAAALKNEDSFEYAKRFIRFEEFQRILALVRYVYEQLVILLDYCPSEQHPHNQVHGETVEFIKNSPVYNKVLEICQNVLQLSKTTLADMASTNSHFLSAAKTNDFEISVEGCITRTHEVLEIFKTAENQYLPVAEPLRELLHEIELIKKDTLKNISEEIDLKDTPLDNDIENTLHCALMGFQKLYKKYKPLVESPKKSEGSSPKKSGDSSGEGEDEDSIVEHHLKKQIFGDLKADWESINLSGILEKLSYLVLAMRESSASPSKTLYIKQMVCMLPILEQYQLFCEYYLLQQLASHKVSVKMLSVLLTVFVEISSKGFCVPADLMQDEEGQAKSDQKKGEGFGLEDGTGENDASDKIESEDQLDDAKRPEDRKNEDNKEQEDCKEEKGIEMSDDFDGKMQDIEKPEEDDSGESEEEEEELDKEMGETEEGADKLDDQIWGDDEDKEEEEEEKDLNEDDGKGTKDEKDNHNDLDAKNDAAKEHDDEQQDDGLDATDEPSEQKDKRKKQEKDIDDMNDQEGEEEQTNAMHNELEEPPEPEDMDLGEMNNVDEGQEGDDQQDTENPFDIDNMKDTMQPPEEEAEEEKPEDTPAEGEGDASDSDDSGEEEEDDKLGSKDPEPSEDVEENPDDSEEPETQTRGEHNEDEEKEQEEDKENEEPREEKPEEYKPSMDKPSKEEVQSVPDTNEKASADQAEAEQASDDVKQDQKMDEQETGEEKDGVGQADNDVDDQGHQGIADTKETVSMEERKQERDTKEKRKQGKTNEDRSLGEAEQNKMKHLKTVDKLDDRQQKKDSNEEEADKPEAEEYQHVKEPQKSDKTTLDNATEDQAHKIQHQEDVPKEDEDENPEGHDELMEEDEQQADKAEEELEKREEMAAEKFDQKSDKPSKNKREDEQAETEEKMEVEGEIVPTISVPRSNDTTAHCIKEILLDDKQAEEMSVAETLEMRKVVHQQLTSTKTNRALPDDCENWQVISNRMSQNARELCEQLRLILEPTKCTRLKGDYRTGRRINMKKIIPYIASQFRKDKIWLRRTKPAQRDYKITIAIDDSKSMDHNNSRVLTLEAVSLVSQALTLLESGRLSVMTFGQSPQIVLNHTEQFDGPKLVNALNFEQTKTKIAELLDFIRVANAEEGAGGCSNGLFENLLLVLSDGRNIFSEGKAKVRNAIKLARLQRIFIVYVIIDNPENKNSILDIQSVESLPNKGVTIKSYLEDFPFPYYVIVRDLNQLPLVLSEAMRQWFELVNSEQ